MRVRWHCIFSVLCQIKIMYINPWFWRFSLFSYKYFFAVLLYSIVEGEYLYVLIYDWPQMLRVAYDPVIWCWYGSLPNNFQKNRRGGGIQPPTPSGPYGTKRECGAARVKQICKHARHLQAGISFFCIHYTKKHD